LRRCNVASRLPSSAAYAIKFIGVWFLGLTSDLLAKVESPLFDQSGQGGLLTNSAHPFSALPLESDITQRDRYVCFDLKSGH
jgi:hypothetical protein